MLVFKKWLVFCLGVVLIVAGFFPLRNYAFASEVIPQDEMPDDSPDTLVEDSYFTYLPTILNSTYTVSEPDLEIFSVSFPSDNKIRHYTTAWPDFVFRRVNWLTVQIGFSGDYQIDTDHFSWSVLEPGQVDYQPIPEYTPELPDTSWAVREISTLAPYHTVEIFIPAGAALGEHQFGVSLYRELAAKSALQDQEVSPPFNVILNPFNDDSDPRKDTDVYNAYFSPTEVNYYALSDTERNYYGWDYINLEWVLGREVIWYFNMFDPIVFDPVIAEVQGVRSAKDAVRLLTAKARWDHRISDIVPKDSDIIDGEWRTGYTFNWRNVPEMMSFWNLGAAHPTGQCMDFGGLMAAMARAIGVPVRLVTCAYCHSGLGYDFHVWTEVWLNEVNAGAWSAVDSMEDVGPVRRDDPYFREQLTDGLAVYTYDARTGKRIDVMNQY